MSELAGRQPDASDRGMRSGAGAVRTWPARSPSLAERIELACAACGADWWIHFDLAGYRLRCHCGAWIRVPPDPRSPASLRGRLAALAALPLRRRPPALPVHRSEPEAVTAEVSAPSAPRRRPTRGLLLLGGLGLALALPGLALSFTGAGAESALYRPLASLLAGLVVLATGLFSDRHTLAALRGSAPRFFAEGLAGAFAVAALALGWNRLFDGAETGAVAWQAVLRDQLGYGFALFLTALCPAVFEELAFRGLFQGRASALFGRRAGMLLSGAAFGLAHGITGALPIQILLGLHLASLRTRGRSLLPCIVEHFLFSALLVLLL